MIANITGDFSGTVEEDVVVSTSGKVTVTDLDPGQDHARAQVNRAGLFGTFNVDIDGNWTYALDHNRINWLPAGQTRTDSFTIVSTDGSASQAIVITITGTNDAASITGTLTGSVVEDTTSSTAWGTVTVIDPDSGQNRPQASVQAGSYGTFTIGTNGNWSYALDHSLADPLLAGEVVTDSFTILSADGTGSQDVVITVTGSNEKATIAGSFAGAAPRIRRLPPVDRSRSPMPIPAKAKPRPATSPAAMAPSPSAPMATGATRSTTG